MIDNRRPAARRDRNRRNTAGIRAAYWSPGFGMRVQNGIGAVLLCAGFILLPFLATLDLGVAVGCREVGRPACLQLISHSIALPVMGELGMRQ